MEKIKILGVDIDNVSFNEALDKVTTLIEEGRKGNPKYVVKPNAEIVTYAQSDSEFKKILNSANFAPSDGIGLIIGSNILKMQGRALSALRERVGGPELMEAILGLAERRDFSVYFLGAAELVVKKLVDASKNRWPKLKIVGYNHGHFKSDTEVVILIQKSKPDILFVALGFPKQEKFIYNNLNKLKIPLSIAEGGSFDFISSEIRRAPIWMRKIGLEWLFRLILEPKRIRRQLSLPKFLWLILQKGSPY